MPARPTPPTRPALLLTAVVLAVLAGCASIEPQAAASPTPAPAPALPAHWDAAHDDLPAAVQPQAWWKAFGDAQLDSLVERGLGQGLDVRMAQARLEQARGLALSAGSAGLPALGLGVDASQASAGSGTTTRKASATLRAAWTPDLWGDGQARAQAALGTAEAAGQDLDTARLTLAAGIATAYLQTLALDERIQLATRIADDAQSLLALVEKQAQLGAASPLDVQQQRSTLQGFQAAIPVLRLQRTAWLGQLAVLVDRAPQGFSLAAPSLLQLAVPPMRTIAPADAVAGRPEVRAAQARLQAAHFDIAVARAAFLPSVSLSAQAGWQWQPQAALASMAGSALQALFDGGQREGQLRVSRAHAEELATNDRQAVLRVLQETEAQLAAAQGQQDAEALGQVAVASARESLRLSRIRFEHGAADLLAVIINERTLYQAQDTLLQTRLQRLLAAVGLYRALGGRVP